MLPTGKNALSFSEIKTWLDCGWRHKLVYIDKLSKYEDSIFSNFGTIVHQTCEHYLKTREMKKDECLEQLTKTWNEKGYPNVPNWPSYNSAVPELDYWLDTTASILDAVPAFLDETFPDWTFVDAEERVEVPIPGSEVNFKGFIDVVIKVPRGKGHVYYLLDWKTSGPRGWSSEKIRDPNVNLQLRLYKDFWSQKHNVPMKDIRCGFVLLKRLEPDPKQRKATKPSFIPVSVGPKAVESARKSIRNIVTSLMKSVFIKNRTSCTFCEFNNTPHCKINL